MRSKIYCSNFVKASFVKQLWIMGLTAFAYFLAMLLPLTVMVNNWQESVWYEWEGKKEAYSQFILQADGAYVLLVGMAVVMAVIQFSYLHSKRQMDFYGSLSVKKWKLFSQRIFFSYMDFVIPYTVILAVCYVIGMLQGVTSGQLFVYVVEMWIVNQLGFLLMFLTCTLAMVLTGREWVGILGSCVFLAGGYLIQWIRDLLAQTFFTTIYTIETGTGISWFSPVYVLYQLRNGIFKLADTEVLISGDFVLEMFAVSIVIILLYLLNCIAVQRRPAEKAGQSMAFEIPARIIHIILSMVGGITVGMIIMTVVYINEQIWFFMGSVLGTLFFYGVIQFIYTLDVKRMLAHKWQIAAAEGIILLICAVYGLDLFGYDRYIPAQKDVESLAICYGDGNTYSGYFSNGVFYSGIEYALENMNLEINDSIYAMLEDVVSGVYTGEELDYYSVYVGYHLKNGKDVKRRYLIPLSEYMDISTALYDQNVFRETMFPTLRKDIQEDTRYEDLDIWYGDTCYTIYNSEQEEKMNEFISVYNAEIEEMDASVLAADEQVAKMNLYLEHKDGLYGVTYELPVYEECTETLKWLTELKLDPKTMEETEALE